MKIEIIWDESNSAVRINIHENEKITSGICYVTSIDDKKFICETMQNCFDVLLKEVEN